MSVVAAGRSHEQELLKAQLMQELMKAMVVGGAEDSFSFS